MRPQQEQQMTGLADDVNDGYKETANVNVRLGLGVDVDAKDVAQHGCSLVVYRSFSSSCFVVVIVDCDCGAHLYKRGPWRWLCAVVGQELGCGSS
jgi:hypothetical protein